MSTSKTLWTLVALALVCGAAMAQAVGAVAGVQDPKPIRLQDDFDDESLDLEVPGFVVAIIIISIIVVIAIPVCIVLCLCCGVCFAAKHAHSKGSKGTVMDKAPQPAVDAYGQPVGAVPMGAAPMAGPAPYPVDPAQMPPTAYDPAATAYPQAPGAYPGTAQPPVYPN